MSSKCPTNVQHMSGGKPCDPEDALGGVWADYPQVRKSPINCLGGSPSSQEMFWGLFGRIILMSENVLEGVGGIPLKRARARAGSPPLRP